MSDHLPECPCNHADERGCFLISAETDRCVDCICPQLRACEQRVEREWIEHCNRVEQRVREDERALIAVEQTTLAELNAEYRKGLDAAREAVERVSTLFEPLGPALAAIDALREEQAPPPLPPSVGVPSKPMWPLREEQK